MNLKFGTDGIRGPVETHITPEACLRIGHATGIVMKEQGWGTVMIGKIQEYQDICWNLHFKQALSLQELM